MLLNNESTYYIDEEASHTDSYYSGFLEAVDDGVSV